MDALRRFGRTARFDYLTMLAKLGLANIAPGSPYLIGATGPLKGARLLFGFSGPPSRLDTLTTKLGSHLGLAIGRVMFVVCFFFFFQAQFPVLCVANRYQHPPAETSTVTTRKNLYTSCEPVFQNRR